MPCAKNCVQTCCAEPQLCVDAQFFVPSSIGCCWATQLKFTANGDTELAIGNPSSTAAGEASTMTVSWGGNTIGELTITTDAEGTVTACDVAGLNGVPVPEGGAVLNDNGCTATELNAMGFLTCSFAPDGENDLVDLIMEDMVIGTVTVVGTSQSVAFTLGGQSDYVPDDAHIPNSIVEVEPKGGLKNDQAAKIGAACLCLQLRANKNTMFAGEVNGNEAFPDGVYDICLNHKPCRNSGNWENLHVLRISKTTDTATPPVTTVSGVWGADTSASGTAVQDSVAAVFLRPKGTEHDVARMTVCGSLQKVFENQCDFALCIENVMQAFSLVSANGPVKPVVLTPPLTKENGPIPHGALELDRSKVCLKAELANSKLYMTIKVQCQQNIASFDDTTGKPCCPGGLNPYTPFQFPGQGYYSVKGFCLCEITHMQDHPLHCSQLSREVTCCVTKTFIDTLDECEE